MNYASIRDRIQSGDLIALTHTSFATWYDLQVQAVRFGTQSEYSHVGLLWVMGGRVWVVESVTPKIRLVPLSMVLNEAGANGIYWAPLGSPMSEDEEKFALAHVGRGDYSKWQAILAQLKKLKIGADDQWECAELVITARRISGVDLGDKATPSAVIRAAQARGAPVYLVTE